MKKLSNAKSRSALVFGGAGFIGQFLVKKLLARTWYVTVFDDFSNARALKPHRRLNVVRADICDYPSVKQVVMDSNPDAIVNLAAKHYIPWCIAHPQETRRVNVLGLRNILRALPLLSHVPDIVFASSAAVYADSSWALTERSMVSPMDVYGESKRIGELIVREGAKKLDYHYSLLRLFNVYGPGDLTPHLIPRIVAQANTRKTSIALGNVEPQRDYVYVDDVAEAFYQAVVLRHKHEVFNIGTGTSYSAMDVISELNRYRKKRGKRALTVVQRPELMRLVDRMQLLADSSKAQRLLKWKLKISFRIGLMKTIKKKIF